MSARVVGLARDGAHRFSKVPAPELRLLEGLGVEGDAHAGVTVKHRSRVAADPTQPNLRQVHLIHAELFDDLAAQGFSVAPAELGENVTTRGIDLLGLPRGTLLRLGADAVVEVTGLRNPCSQIEAFRPGLLARVAFKDAAGELVRLTGVMGIVRAGGVLRVGDGIGVTVPAGPHARLERV
jgi:MOSC domain-containing protein YiiM